MPADAVATSAAASGCSPETPVLAYAQPATTTDSLRADGVDSGGGVHASVCRGSSVNLTGSPDYGARIRIAGDPGKGCSNERYRQFNTAAFAGPTYYSDGMESGQNYMTACSTSIWDLAIARNIRLGGTRNVQIRIEMYNALDSAFWTSRSTTVQYVSPTDQTLRNAQYLADGTLDPTRLKPNVAGFGAANNTSSPRNFQLQLRFSF